jgi:hypothetical protein
LRVKDMSNLPVNQDKIRVVACPHPFKVGHEEHSFAPSISLAQIFKEVQPDMELRGRAHIWVNDSYVSPEQWDATFPEAGADIAIRVVPAGKVGRVIGMVFVAIAAIVVSVFSMGTLGPMMGLAVGTMGNMLLGGLAGMAVGIIGNMVLNALIPPVSPGSAGTLANLSSLPGVTDYGATSPTLSINGASNRQSLYGPVPRMLGRFRVAPSYGARTYTEAVDGVDQYLRLYLIWGFGPVQISDLRIGQTPLENFQGVEIEHRNLTYVPPAGTGVKINILAVTEGAPAGIASAEVNASEPGVGYLVGDALTVVQEGASAATLQVEAIGEGGKVTEFSIVTPGEGYSAANGLAAIVSRVDNPITYGNDPITLYPKTIHEQPLSMDLNIPYPEVGSEHIYLSGYDADELSVDVVCPGGLFGVDPPTGAKLTKELNIKVSFRRAGTEDPWIDRLTSEGYTGTTNSWIPAVQAGPSFLPPEAWTNPWLIFFGFAGKVTGGYFEAHSYSVEPKYMVLYGASSSAARKTMSWQVPRLPGDGQYEVRLLRMTPADGAFSQSTAYWTALRTITNEDPLIELPLWLNPATGNPEPRLLAKTAIRIKASGQISGTVEEFSGIAHSICPDWNKNGLTSVQVNAPGSGYSINDALAIIQEGASGAAFLVEAVGDNGEVTEVSIVGKGKGYLVAANLATQVSHVNGSNCVIDILTVNIIIDEYRNSGTLVSINNSGYGYSVGDILTVIQEGGEGCQINVDSVSVIYGQVNGISLISAGTGYTGGVGLETTVSPGGGSGCTIEYIPDHPTNLTHTEIATVQINPDRPGINYSVGDVLDIRQPGGSGGTLRIDAVGEDGEVTQVFITSVGVGYAPAVGLRTVVTHVDGSGCTLDILGVEDAWVVQTTQNPASLYREAVQGKQCQKPLSDDRLDLSRLQYWHEYCATQGWQYNKNIDYLTTIKSLLDEIAASGRAAFAWLDSRLGVIIDEPQPFAIGPAFTPRNILKDSFQATIAYPDMPHAFRIPFRNEDQGFQQDERIVLDDGYQMGGRDAWGVSHPGYPAATIFEQLELPGVTKSSLVFKHARYHIAAARLRSETIQFGTDMEWLVATRGDRFKFSHDVMLAGLSWGRVVGLLYEGDDPDYITGVVVDEMLPMEEGKNYVLRFRLADNTSLLWPIETSVYGFLSDGFLSDGFYSADNKMPEYVILKTPVHISVTHPEVGDLFLFGESELEAIDLIVKSIQPNSDLSAKITAVAYDERIYTADEGIIPVHESAISSQFEWSSPIVTDVRSGDSVLLGNADGSWTERILLTLSIPYGLSDQISKVEAQFWLTGSDESPTFIPAVPISSGEVSLIPVEKGRSYNYRLRYVKKDGATGPWSATQTHVVIGKIVAPPGVGEVAITQQAGVVTIAWNPVDSPDVIGYAVRYGSGTTVWPLATVITENYRGTSLSTTLPVGAHDIMIKAVDNNGNQSAVESRDSFFVTYEAVVPFSVADNTERLALTPVVGEIVFQLDDEDLFVCTNTE